MILRERWAEEAKGSIGRMLFFHSCILERQFPCKGGRVLWENRNVEVVIRRIIEHQESLPPIKCLQSMEYKKQSQETRQSPETRIHNSSIFR